MVRVENKDLSLRFVDILIGIEIVRSYASILFLFYCPTIFPSGACGIWVGKICFWDDFRRFPRRSDCAMSAIAADQGNDGIKRLVVCPAV